MSAKKKPKLLTMRYIADTLGLDIRHVLNVLKRHGAVDNIGGRGRGAHYVTTKARIRDCGLPQIANLL